MDNVELTPQTDAGSPPKMRKMVSLPAVLEVTGFSRQTLWRRIRAKAFPAPVTTGGDGGRVKFFEDEIASWQEAQERVAGAAKAVA